VRLFQVELGRVVEALSGGALEDGVEVQATPFVLGRLLEDVVLCRCEYLESPEDDEREDDAPVFGLLELAP